MSARASLNPKSNPDTTSPVAKLTPITYAVKRTVSCLFGH